VVGMALKSWRRPVVSGGEELLGARGHAVKSFATEGSVHLHGEIWQARTDQPLAAHQPVRVTGREGLVLLVTPTEGKETAS
jgi:membrane-bound serine protease (ClpP class)